MPAATLKAVALNCTLKPAPEESSCELLLTQILAALSEHDVEADGEIIRLVDLDIKPGVLSDQGDGDEWPGVRKRILDANILIFGTAIWMGHPSSVCQRVLERLDAFLAETDEHGRMVSYDRAALVAVVGNEDGAHHVFAEVAQGLSDTGFSIPPEGSVYWVGEAMQGIDYKDKSPTPEPTATAIATGARNVAHLARVLSENGYPAG
jgi:multimeric flavodoxin WrbA